MTFLQSADTQHYCDYNDNRDELQAYLEANTSVDENECMLVSDGATGYHVFTFPGDRKKYKAYVVGATVTRGDHPGYEVDLSDPMALAGLGKIWHASHLCHNPRCCNPEHLDFEQSWINTAMRYHCADDTGTDCSCHFTAPNGKPCLKKVVSEKSGIKTIGRRLEALALAVVEED